MIPEELLLHLFCFLASHYWLGKGYHVPLNERRSLLPNLCLPHPPTSSSPLAGFPSKCELVHLKLINWKSFLCSVNKSCCHLML
jgi:hypothetical protein